MKKRDLKRKQKHKQRTEHIDKHFVGDLYSTQITSAEQLSTVVETITKRRKVGKRSLRYKMVPGEYDMLLEVQQHKCAICREPFLKTPCIDHCHVTGSVRALLCGKCNSGLGMFHENIEYMTNAIKYLKNFKRSS